MVGFLMRNPDRREYFRKVLRETHIEFYKEIAYITSSSTPIDEFINKLINKKVKSINIAKGEAQELWMQELESSLYDEYLKIKNKIPINVQ
jgi:uroporphyrinogen-III synthase